MNPARPSIDGLIVRHAYPARGAGTPLFAWCHRRWLGSSCEVGAASSLNPGILLLLLVAVGCQRTDQPQTPQPDDAEVQGVEPASTEPAATGEANANMKANAEPSSAEAPIVASRALDEASSTDFDAGYLASPTTGKGVFSESTVHVPGMGRPDADDLPSFGFSVIPPESWTRDLSEQPSGYAGRWVINPSDEESWSQFAVRLTREGQATAQQLSQRWIQSGYRVKEIQLDGWPVLRLDRPTSQTGPDRPMPSPVYITVRDGNAYVILFMLDAQTPSEVAAQTAAKWRWLKTGPVVENLTLGSRTSILGGQVKVRLPSLVRREPPDPALSGDLYMAFDYARGQDAIMIHVSPFDRPQNSLEAAATERAESLQAELELKRPVTFHLVAGKPKLRVASPITRQFDLADGRQVTRRSWFAVWEPTAGLFVNVHCLVNDEMFVTPAERQRVAAFVEYWIAQLETVRG